MAMSAAIRETAVRVRYIVDLLATVVFSWLKPPAFVRRQPVLQVVKRAAMKPQMINAIAVISMPPRTASLPEA